MMIAGTHVPVRDTRLRAALAKGGLITVGVGLVSVPVGAGLSHLAGTGHTWVYAVVLASSSAALVLPVVEEDKLAGPAVLTMLAQVVVADVACIVALPLAAAPDKAGRSAVGALVVIVAAAAVYLVLRQLDRRHLLRRAHHYSVKHTFGLELRVSLLILFALAGLAQNVHVSILLAGFSVGLVLAATGTPRRLGRQLFGLAEGFLGPIFFLWLGATIDLGALGSHPKLLLLAAGLAAGTLRDPRRRMPGRAAAAAGSAGRCAARGARRCGDPRHAEPPAGAWGGRRDPGGCPGDRRGRLGGRLGRGRPTACCADHRRTHRPRPARPGLKFAGPAV